LFVVPRREAHFITGVALIEEVGLSGEEVEKRVCKLLDPSNFFADGQVKLVKSLITHIFKILINLDHSIGS
jgi:hypothetical protein